MKIIYKPWGSDPAENPKGYPAAYPRDSTLVPDIASTPDGWTEISQQDYSALIQSHYSAVAAINAQEQAPEEVLLWQFRAAVTLAGLKDAVDAAVAALPEPSKTVATEKWEYGNTVRRNHAMITSLSASLGLTSNQVDNIFKTAASLQ